MCLVRMNFYFSRVEIPLPRPDRLAASQLPSLVLRRAVLAHSKAISRAEFVKGEQSECSLPLTTLLEE